MWTYDIESISLNHVVLSHIAVLQISLSVSYAHTTEVKICKEKLKKKLRLQKCCWTKRYERRDVTTISSPGRRGALLEIGQGLREDRRGSWWPLGRDWVTGQGPGENFWILHRSYWLWISWIGGKMRWVWKETVYDWKVRQGARAVLIQISLKFDVSHNF